MTKLVNCERLTLYFILTLAIIAVGLWTIFLIQLSKLVEQTNDNQLQHVIISNQSKQNTELNVNMTKINKKNIENILNNISAINNKIDK
jgi:hypothetical protein